MHSIHQELSGNENYLHDSSKSSMTSCSNQLKVANSGRTVSNGHLSTSRWRPVNAAFTPALPDVSSTPPLSPLRRSCLRCADVVFGWALGPDCGLITSSGRPPGQDARHRVLHRQRQKPVTVYIGPRDGCYLDTENSSLREHGPTPAFS